MLLDFNNVVENEIQIKEMTGLTREQFNELHIDVERIILERKKKISGIPGKIKNKKINLLITLYHMKGYVVQRQMAMFFGVSQPQRECNIVSP